MNLNLNQYEAALDRVSEIERLRDSLSTVPLMHLSLNDIKYIEESLNPQHSTKEETIRFYSNDRLIKLRRLSSKAMNF